MSSEANENTNSPIPEDGSFDVGESSVHMGQSDGSADISGAPQDKPEALETALRDAEERYVRLYADFENFKRRASREREEVRRSTTESIVSKLIPVLDNFEMALQAIQQPGTPMQTVQVGVEMILGQLKSTFTDLGVEEVDALGKPFDPTLHDAVSQQETHEIPEGQVTQQTRKGYRLRERLIRPASVVVAKAPGDASEGESAPNESIEAQAAPSDRSQTASDSSEFISPDSR